MKSLLRILLFSTATIGICTPAMAQTTPPVNKAYTYGESATYKVKYSAYINVNVGEVVFSIDPNPQTVAKIPCYHITAKGYTYNFYDKIYKVRDQYETFIDTRSSLPAVFIRNVEEGAFKFNEYVLFNQSRNLAKSKKRIQKIPKYTQDVLSAIYLARTFDYSNSPVGQNFYINAFIDDSVYNVGVKYMGKQTLTTDLGTFKVIKLEPILIVDRIFTSNSGMVLYVSDDANCIPIRIESGISVGRIRADLTSYSGLRNPLTSKQ